MSIFGKMRARVKKSKKFNVRIKTATAVIGVKGTDFVVEYVEKKTTVGTLRGLVNMMSSITNESIDIPKGKMSSVSASGTVLPLTEFAGELLKDVEFAGEQMEEDDYSGEKVVM